MPYAEGTSVSADRSRAEIEKILTRFGADAFGYGTDGDRAVVAFRAEGRQIRFTIQVPVVGYFARTKTGQSRSASAMRAAHDKELRRRWRSLALVVKAKLEAVESGIVSFEEEFAAFTVLPDGRTVGEWLEPQLAEAYETGAMPSLLPGTTPQLTETT